MLKNARIIFVVIGLYLMANAAIAETIYLKSGKKVEGTIVKKTASTVQVDFEGITITYYTDEIERIEGGVPGEETSPISKDPGRDTPSGEDSPPRRFSSQEEMKAYYEDILRDDPNNFDAHLQMAGMYLYGGFGPQAIAHIEMALSIDRERAIKEEAYTNLSMAYYYAGNFKMSYLATEEALRHNPDDPVATKLKDMLDTLAEKEWGGKLPEDASWHGYESAGEMSKAMMKRGIGRLGDTVDSIVLDFAQLQFTPPPGWHKQSSAQAKLPGNALLFYTKGSTPNAPKIGVTRDSPGSEVKKVADFTQVVRAEMIRMSPELIIAEPQTVTIAGHTAATFDMTHPQSKVRSYWYQFLIGENIISVQLLTAADSFEQDFVEFKKFAESMRVVGFSQEK